MYCTVQYSTVRWSSAPADDRVISHDSEGGNLSSLPLAKLLGGFGGGAVTQSFLVRFVCLLSPIFDSSGRVFSSNTGHEREKILKDNMLHSRMMLLNEANKKKKKKNRTDLISANTTNHLGKYCPDSCKHHIHIGLHLPSDEPAEKFVKIEPAIPLSSCARCAGWPAASMYLRASLPENI